MVYKKVRNEEGGRYLLGQERHGVELLLPELGDLDGFILLADTIR